MVAGALVQLGSNNNQTCSLFKTDPKKLLRIQIKLKLYLERVKEPVRKGKVLPQSPVLLQVVGLDQRRLVGDGRRVEGPAEGGEGGQGT